MMNMNSLKDQHGPRPESPVSISDSSRSILSRSSIDSSARRTSPVFETHYIERPRKGLDGVGAKRSVSALRAIVSLIMVSMGGFFSGRHASLTLPSPLSMQAPACHESGMDSLRHEASMLERQGNRTYIRPFMAHFWVDKIRNEPRTFRRTKEPTTSEEERRKRFAAHVIHPSLLTVMPMPTSIAIAIDGYHNPTANIVAGNQLAGDLLSEIAMYRDIERISVIFVNEDDSNHGTDCPSSLVDILASNEKEHINMECSYVSPLNKSGSSIRKHHDVSVVLANCGKDGKSKWEEDLYATTKSVAVKCVGRNYPLDHYHRLSKTVKKGKKRIKSKKIQRIEHFFAPNLKRNPSADAFLHVTDYDIFDERGIATNLAIAFRSIKNGLHQWRSPETYYQIAMHQRWQPSVSLDHFFASSDMLRIQFPSRQSAVTSCNHYKHLIDEWEGDEEYFCEQGLDTDYGYAPASDFYVGKSNAGENAGRGVFPSIDLEPQTYIMPENFGHDVVFSHRGFGVLEKMVGTFCLQKEEDELRRQQIRLDPFQCIAGIYYDAYGYNSIPLGMPVNTGKNTFINHGCRGSANICDEMDGIETEFSMLSDSESIDPNTYVIPDNFRNTKIYNPNWERNDHLLRYDSYETTTDSDMPAHTEILDNYVGFGGERYFLVQIVALKDQCSGAEGTVLTYEGNKRGAHKYDMLGSPFLMDIDEVYHRQFAADRETGKATDE